MRADFLTWPRLIGVAAGLIGIAPTVGFAVELASGNTGTVHNPPQLAMSICAFVFLLLTYPLYTGRDWARRTLLVITICFTIAATVFVVAQVNLAFRGLMDNIDLTWQSRFDRRIGAIAIALLFLTPPLFLTAALLHNDVRRAFRHRRLDDKAATI